MIYVEMNGRCGNQLFDYSFARKMSILLNDKMTLNYHHVLKHAGSDPSWRNELLSFCVAPFKIENQDKPLIYSHGNILQIALYVFFLTISKIPYKSRNDLFNRQEKFQPLLNIFGIFFLEHGYSRIRKPITKNVFINGTYEDERWFDDIRDVLIKEIIPCEINHRNDELVDKMRSTNSVCVSIRRGDFLSPENSKLRNICTKEYYEEACKIVIKSLRNPVFFFFSDDIEWVKANISVGHESYYEVGDDTVANKLYMMSSCKHFIMSNSTFCWWAEYLSKYHEVSHIVVSPDHWLNIPGYKHQLINKEWTLVEC